MDFFIRIKLFFIILGLYIIDSSKKRSPIDNGLWKLYKNNKITLDEILLFISSTRKGVIEEFNVKNDFIPSDSRLNEIYILLNNEVFKKS